MLTKRAPQGYGAELLRTYRSIWQDKQPVVDEEQNLVHSHLKLAGVVRRDGRQLVVRNRLYREVFTAAWIKEHNPEDFWKRYGPVLKWAVPVSVSAVLVAGVMTALALEARRQSLMARQQTELAKRAQRRALVQENQATRQERLAKEAEARAKASETMALARERDTQRALLQLRQSQRQERQALTIAEEQRQRAEQEAVVARKQRDRAEQQTLLARSQTALASLRAQVAQALNLLPTTERASGLVLAMDAWARSQSEPATWGASAAALLQAWLGAQEMNLLKNGQLVTAMAYSPDSKVIASGSEDGRVRLWDANRGLVIHETIVGKKNVILSLAFSPDGKVIASGGRDGKIRIWDAKSGAPIGSSIGEHELDGDRHDLNGVFSVKFSPNGRTIASGGGDGTVRLWNTKSGAALGLPLKGHQGGVLSLAYSPNGRTIASVGKDGTLRLWDAKSGAALSPPLMAQEGFHPIMLPKFVNSVAFDPEGRTIITGANNGRVRLWDAVKQVPIGKPLLSGGDSVKSIAFSPDGRLFVSGSADGTIRLWDVNSAFQRATSTLDFDDSMVFRLIRGHAAPVSSVVISPDGSRLASGSDDQTIRIWELPIYHELAPNRAREPSAEVIPPLPSIGQIFKNERSFTFGNVLSVNYSPNGRKIISFSIDGKLRFWDSVSGSAIGAPLRGPVSIEEQVAFSPDGRLIASSAHVRTIQLWDAKSGTAIGALLRGHEGSVRSVAFSPDGRVLASGADDGTVRLWDAKSGSAIGAPLKGHADWVHSVAFSPDGRLIASGSGDRTVRLWDAKSGVAIGVPLKGHEARVWSVAFSPDGRLIASGSNDGTVRLWDGKSGVAIGAPLRGHEGGVWSVAFSPDGRLIASGGRDRTVRLWETRTGIPVGTPLGMDWSEVRSLTFSPDGNQIATAGSWARRWVASPREWYRLSCARLAHHPLLRDPASVSTDQEVIAAGKRVARACQAPSRSAQQPQRQGPGPAFALLRAWAKGLLGG
jgi:WD40 repeat protein